MSAQDPGDPHGAVQRLGNHIPIGGLLDSEVILDRFLAWTAKIGLELYPAQEEALLELMTGRHVILSTPTGSGKSLVALGLHWKAMCEERRSFYTAPIKALVSEKFFDLCEHFGAENVGMLTGDASINWAAPIICCTAEVLANMALSQGEAADVPYVIMDEFHYYGDRDRGSAWQIPLITLPHTRFLLMSATLGDTRDIEEHLEARTGRSVARVHSDERPVPLDFSYALTPIHETVEKLLATGRAPIYIVHFTQREAAEKAQALTSANICDKEAKRAVAEAIAEFRFDSPYGRDMKRFLLHGIGLHHAGLLPKYRLLVERLAQQGLLRVVCGTDTLGVGVNVPIRTVLFTKLCKFDGEKVTILSARDFKQISGRAGRKGFDDEGSVVVQAPEHVVLNKRLEAKARGAGPSGRKKIVKKKPPTKGFVPWNQETFERLVASPPEALTPHFPISHGLIVSCLKSDAAGRSSDAGYRLIAELIDHCHQDPRRKPRLLRDAARLFRSLRGADIVEVVKDERDGRPTLRVSEDLQRDFSLHHSLSLYLVDAAATLDRSRPDYALDLLSVAEAILEDPRPILIAQERKAKGELIAKLKAEGVPYEERMEKLEDVTWPRPNAELIWASFDLFVDRHPWVDRNDIRPKGIARDIYETSSSFVDWLKRMELARVEGLLLRYLGQLHDVLARTVPAVCRTDEVQDITGYLRALVGSVDSSLVEAWEDLIHPGQDQQPDAVQPIREYDLAADTRALRARIRGELQRIVRALAARRYGEALDGLHSVSREEWTPERIEAELQGFYAENEAILYDPRARQAHLCVIHEEAPRLWRVQQSLLDDRGEDTWHLRGEVDLRQDRNPQGPLFRLIRIGE
ncbi:MAG: DUF3516 domain-containing protein [Deltaproteobacteria bacterium]|nr:DUF3516 domain-containing protein [Deltaproteobacteria bacterium]